ncbi:MAG: hypothetical protein LUB61_05640 [Eggerthellaceae bacterium]|nr:hypothetical protein [Eggerthellaceae bacterium]
MLLDDKYKKIGVITNGEVFNGSGFEAWDVYMGDEYIVSEPADAEGEVLDASGCYVVPGFIDLHFHGSVGADMSDGDLE